MQFQRVPVSKGDGIGGFMEDDEESVTSLFGESKEFFGSEHGKRTLSPEVKIQFLKARGEQRGMRVNLFYSSLEEITYWPKGNRDIIDFGFYNYHVQLIGERLIQIYEQVCFQSVGWIREAEDHEKPDGESAFVKQMDLYPLTDWEARHIERKERRLGLGLPE